jgi:hypothetical protein
MILAPAAVSFAVAVGEATSPNFGVMSVQLLAGLQAGRSLVYAFSYVGLMKYPCRANCTAWRLEH